MNNLFSLPNCPLKVFIFFISDIVMFGIISNMVFKITSKYGRRGPTCFYFCILWSPNARVLLQSLYKRSCAYFCPLYMKRSFIQPLSMKALAPLHNHGFTADSNGDENTHASSFKKVTMSRVVDEKESKSRLKESNLGSTVIHHDGKKCCGIGALDCLAILML